MFALFSATGHIVAALLVGGSTTSHPGGTPACGAFRPDATTRQGADKKIWYLGTACHPQRAELRPHRPWLWQGREIERYKKKNGAHAARSGATRCEAKMDNSERRHLERRHLGRHHLGRRHFRKTLFRETSFRKTSFRKTSFRETSFRKTSFRKTSFGETSFGKTSFWETSFGKTSFMEPSFGKTSEKDATKGGSRRDVIWGDVI